MAVSEFNRGNFEGERQVQQQEQPKKPEPRKTISGKQLFEPSNKGRLIIRGQHSFMQDGIFEYDKPTRSDLETLSMAPDSPYAVSVEEPLIRVNRFVSRFDSDEPMAISEVNAYLQEHPNAPIEVELQSNQKYFTARFLESEAAQLHVLRETTLTHTPDGLYEARSGDETVKLIEVRDENGKILNLKQMAVYLKPSVRTTLELWKNLNDGDKYIAQIIEKKEITPSEPRHALVA